MNEGTNEETFNHLLLKGKFRMKPIEKAEKLYKKVNTFMLSCVGVDGYPMTKAGRYYSGYTLEDFIVDEI